jgi:DNA-3-methyladenine glycosylase
MEEIAQGLAMPRTKSGITVPRAESGAWASASLLPRSFYEHPPELVAPRLLGKLLIHRVRGKILAGRIVEVEAYLGPHNDPPDPAAHTHRGPTPRNAVLFGPPGYAYLYFIYGQYFCLNVSCEPDGKAGGNRGLTAHAKPSLLTSGPSRLCQALGLTRALHNALDFTSADSPLQILDDGFPVPELHTGLHISPRIGIKHAVDWPLRFSVSNHPCVSGPRRGNGLQ